MVKFRPPNFGQLWWYEAIYEDEPFYEFLPNIWGYNAPKLLKLDFWPFWKYWGSNFGFFRALPWAYGETWTGETWVFLSIGTSWFQKSASLDSQSAASFVFLPFFEGCWNRKKWHFNFPSFFQAYFHFKTEANFRISHRCHHKLIWLWTKLGLKRICSQVFLLLFIDLKEYVFVADPNFQDQRCDAGTEIFAFNDFFRNF